MTYYVVGKHVTNFTLRHGEILIWHGNIILNQLKAVKSTEKIITKLNVT